MRRYEIMILITDTIEEEDAQGVFTKAKDILAQQQATVLDEAWWGRRKLAYEIDKREHGFYGVLDFEASPDAVNELERQLKINDNVVRFKTVRPEIRIRHAS